MRGPYASGEPQEYAVIERLKLFYVTERMGGSRIRKRWTHIIRCMSGNADGNALEDKKSTGCVFRQDACQLEKKPLRMIASVPVRNWFLYQWHAAYRVCQEPEDPTRNTFRRVTGLMSQRCF